MHQHTEDIFVCIRNRDYTGLADWLVTLLAMAKDDAARGTTGVMRYDGAVLAPLLQLGDAAISKALLNDPKVLAAMADKSVQHNDWLLNLVLKDPYAWLLALDHGWGHVLAPRPSVIKGMTVMLMHDHVQEYLQDPERATSDNLDPAWAENVWDGWMRVANGRNPVLTTYMYGPTREELTKVIMSSQPLWFRPNMWPILEKVCPGFLAMHQEAQAVHTGLGVVFGSVEQKQVLARALGLAPMAVPEAIAMEFESGH